MDKSKVGPLRASKMRSRSLERLSEYRNNVANLYSNDPVPAGFETRQQIRALTRAESKKKRSVDKRLARTKRAKSKK